MNQSKFCLWAFVVFILVLIECIFQRVMGINGIGILGGVVLILLLFMEFESYMFKNIGSQRNKEKKKREEEKIKIVKKRKLAKKWLHKFSGIIKNFLFIIIFAELLVMPVAIVILLGISYYILTGSIFVLLLAKIFNTMWFVIIILFTISLITYELTKEKKENKN